MPSAALQAGVVYDVDLPLGAISPERLVPFVFMVIDKDLKPPCVLTHSEFRDFFLDEFKRTGTPCPLSKRSHLYVLLDPDAAQLELEYLGPYSDLKTVELLSMHATAERMTSDSVIAARDLGLEYLYNIRHYPEKSREIGIRLLKWAATTYNHPSSKIALAYLFWQGDGVEQSIPKARELLQDAQAKGTIQVSAKATELLATIETGAMRSS
jgi:hypothetical protein